VIKLGDILNEIGEGVTPFPWKRRGVVKLENWINDMATKDKADHNYETLPVLEFEFKGEVATYVAKIGGNFSRHVTISFGAKKPGTPKPFDWNVYVAASFDVIGSDKEVLTNYGEQFKVISTVSDIVIKTINELIEYEWLKVQEIILQPKLEDGEEGKPITQSKRGRLYLAYIKKQGSKLKGNWTAAIEKDQFVIKNGTMSSPTNPDKYINL
jgi:hypothetical protein